MQHKLGFSRLAKTGDLNNLQSSGAYLLSSEITQDPPLDEKLQKKIKVFYEALEIDTQKLHPSTKVAQMMNQINDQLLTIIQFDSMIEKRNADFEMLKAKEEQIESIVSAQTWRSKEDLMHLHQKHVEESVNQALRQGLP
jgi:DNA-directed RNA polymerase